MPYEFQRGSIYRMPTHFGPALGPRQGPDGRKYRCVDGPATTAISVSFQTNRDQLEALLPEGFELHGKPIVTIAASYMKNIGWLAGRGYNILGVSFPAVFHGERDRVQGPFLAVLWENLADPIITGREELGFAKVYCELPEPVLSPGEARCSAGWLGFEFMQMSVSGLEQTSVPSSPDIDGTLHYKYVPRTGEWGEADACYAVLTPVENSNRRVLEHWSGEGTVQWNRARWEDLPTLYPIVNTLAELEVQEYLAGSLVKSVGGKDLSDQRILE